MTKTIRENVEMLLEKYPKARDDDKKLMLLYWKHIDKVRLNKRAISTEDFLEKATIPESIRRARQLVQADRVDLQPSDFVARGRRNKEKSMRSTVLFGQVV